MSPRIATHGGSSSIHSFFLTHSQPLLLCVSESQQHAPVAPAQGPRVQHARRTRAFRPEQAPRPVTAAPAAMAPQPAKPLVATNLGAELNMPYGRDDPGLAPGESMRVRQSPAHRYACRTLLLRLAATRRCSRCSSACNWLLLALARAFSRWLAASLHAKPCVASQRKTRHGLPTTAQPVAPQLRRRARLRPAAARRCPDASPFALRLLLR